jgi:hypothetical protein
MDREMEFCSALRKDGIMSFARKWTEVESIMLSEVSQSHKDKYHMLSLKCGMQGHKKDMKVKVRIVRIDKGKGA